MSNFLSPKDLARAIGMSESSLKRWADDGELRVSRTAGGHRRIALREAIRFIRKAGLPIVDPEVLGLSDLSAAPAADETPDMDSALRQALRDGRAEVVRGIVLAQYLSGRSVAALCDGPISAALHEVGELWRHGPEGIAIEHRAVDICQQSLNHLRSLLPEAESGQPVAIGGALEDDPYTVPTLMVSCVLAAAGWHTVNLGANLPVAALFAAIRMQQPGPRLVWLSCSTEAAAESHEREVRKAAMQLSRQGVKVMVGGRGWGRRNLSGEDGLTYVGSMAEAAGFAEGLRAGRAA